MHRAPATDLHDGAGPSTKPADVDLDYTSDLANHIIAKEPTPWPDDCPVCYDAPAFYTTPCGHAFCLDCLRRLAPRSRDRACPLCRSLIRFSECSPMPGADNDGRPSTSSILRYMKTRPNDVLGTLMQDSGLLHSVLDAHPAEDWFVDAIGTLPQHRLPGSYRISLMMTRLATEIVSSALATHGCDDTQGPIAPSECRLALKAASLDHGLGIHSVETAIRPAAARLGIYAVMCALHARTRGLCLPAPIVFSALHPTQTTLTMVDGTVMNLLQYAIVDVLSHYSDDALRLWALRSPSLAMCPNLLRDIARDPHPNRGDQWMIVAALLSVHYGLSGRRPTTMTRWDRLFEVFCVGPTRLDPKMVPGHTMVLRLLDNVATMDREGALCGRCFGAGTDVERRRRDTTDADDDRFRENALANVLAKVVRVIRPTASYSCLSDDGWMDLSQIKHALKRVAADAEIQCALDHLCDCGMVTKQRPSSVRGYKYDWYRYTP
ncbi:Ring finger protein [Pandoravirus quercus]|uniref:Ring finger protein n=1 Tax=Pandoravirus quercus TaxID=2107709 RepID=A0A2U7U9L9_9VIRU|nr:Ring finger protein [Pandoravirus quercus]AVK75092.1 Ring finger protein [Pandoravirus quercus]